MRRASVATAIALGGLVLAAPASASFHLMKVSEVRPTGGNDAFVELQMHAAGQHLVGGREIEFYSETGTVEAQFSFTGNAAVGADQRTILVGDTGVSGADFTDEQLDAKLVNQEAACFLDPPNTLIDCVAWGDYSAATLPVGNPAAPAGVPASQSITRAITPNCPTLLEAADDTDDSATDFFLASPSPRPNSATPAEVPCGPGLSDTDPPQTKIKKGPKGKVEDDTVKFRFKSDEPNSTFKCKAPGKRFRKCESPKKLKNLDEGKAKFKVFAIDAAGNRDPSPAKRKFRVDAE